MDFKLAGRRALVTGSNTGIGKGIAQILAREGAEVVIHGRKPERTQVVVDEIRKSGGAAHVAIGDLTSDEGADAVANAVKAAVGDIDILVNNVGGLDAYANEVRSWFQVSPADWANAAQQNLVAAVRMIHFFVPAMRERGWGRVINISSGGGLCPTEVVPDYNAAKAGILNLTVSLSKELARSGVTVNTVSPGTVHTEMVERMLDQLAPAFGWPDDYEARVKAFTTSGFFPGSISDLGYPEDLGVLVAYLASPFARFVTGSNYRFDGGSVPTVS